jgi:hypothetical protein
MESSKGQHSLTWFILLKSGKVLAKDMVVSNAGWTEGGKGRHSMTFHVLLKCRHIVSSTRKWERCKSHGIALFVHTMCGF